MDLDLFERVAMRDGALLACHRKSAAEGAPASVLLLTFDVGRLAVRADPARAELVVSFVEAESSAPAGLVDAGEDEPWWRVLGSPLARVWPGGDALAGGVCLQFRADDANPRIITLEPQGESVRIRLENPPGGA